MKYKSIELKVKSKSLEEEAKIIKKEEARAITSAKWERDNLGNQEKTFWDRFQNLAHHRIYKVGIEARATFLARAYISGKKYEEVEQAGRKTCKATHFEKIILPKIVYMVNRYDPFTEGVELEDIKEWVGLKEVNYEV